MPEQKEIRALPAPELNGNGVFVPATQERATGYPFYAYAEPEPEESRVPLSHYLWILRRQKWRILSFIVVCVAGTVVVSSRMTPMFESTATIDIDRNIPSGIIGQDASSRTAPSDTEQFLPTQIKLIQSDSVLRPVAQRFGLNDREAPAGSTQFPSARVENAPVKMRGLKVTRPPNTYLLLISYRSPDPDLAADVANGVAQSYIEHTYNIRFRASASLSTFMERQMEEMKAKMERSSAALAQFERDLSVINPEEKTSILTARLLQLNTEFTTAQGDRVRKQAAFESVSGGSLEAAQASTQGEQLRKLADRIDESREKFAVIRTQYGAGHPEYHKAFSQLSELERQFETLRSNIALRVKAEYGEAVNREEMLKKSVAETKTEFDRINARSVQYKAVKQEAEGDKTFYQELVHKIKEAGINSSFQNNSIRLADSARPALTPVSPDIKLNAILAFLFSTLLGVGAAVLADVLDNTVRDPEQIQRRFQTDVLGSLPAVKQWHGRLSLMAANGAGKAVAKSGTRPRQARFEEAVRTLRDSILLSDLSHRPRSLLITSASPREGKTTSATHLAIANSDQKRLTLLVDADLRRPSIHARFGLSNVRGLRDVVVGEGEWRDLVQAVEGHPELHILVAGEASRQAADSLGSTLKKLLAEAEKEYDLVVIDSPPLLGFAEPLQMAAIVDGVVVIAMAGRSNRNALGSVLSSLKRLKVNVVGVALNGVESAMSDQYYYYGYSGKDYSKYYKPTKE